MPAPAGVGYHGVHMEMPETSLGVKVAGLTDRSVPVVSPRSAEKWLGQDEDFRAGDQVPARPNIIHSRQPERISATNDGLLIITVPRTRVVVKDAAFIQVDPCAQDCYVAPFLAGHHLAGFVTIRPRPRP